MRALMVTPGVLESIRLEERPDPELGQGAVLIRTIAVGICGTDRDLVAGDIGTPPPGRNDLVIGHEPLGRVVRGGAGWEEGELVTATVRRSCGKCPQCADGAYDTCTAGPPPERGIDGLDGFASDFFAEHPKHLVRVPTSLGTYAVLAEPASICERGIRHAFAIAGRQPWRPRRALVLGPGTIGLLSAALLKQRGIDVWVAGRGETAPARRQVVAALGGQYVALEDTDVDGLARELGPDVVIEATGSPELIQAAIGAPGPGGVVCLLGLEGRPRELKIDAGALAADYVLQNRALFGSVNAAAEDWESGLRRLDEVGRHLPEALELMITARFPPERFRDAFDHRGIKAVLAFDEEGER